MIRPHHKKHNSCWGTWNVMSLILLAALGSGCENQTPSQSTAEYLEELGEEIQKVIPTRKDSWDEIKKLRQLEYQIFSFPQHTSTMEIAARLCAAGKERWDCFHIEKILPLSEEGSEEKLLVFCKRLVDTPLRYIPGVSGGILPGGVPGD